MAPLHGMAPDLADLARLAAEPEALDDALDRALAALGELVPYDLAAVLELDGDALKVRHARGRLASSAVRGHVVELRTRPTLRRALETRRAVALTEDIHAHGEGDPYDGVLDLPDGHACMVVPLFVGTTTLGAITLDQDRCMVYEPALVEIAGVVGRIVSLAIAYADQSERLRRAQLRLEERARLLQDASMPDPDRLGALPSAAMRHLVALAKQVAQAPTPVLLQGETGVGKEVLARAIHTWSSRADGPFVTLNCAALPEGLVESELFGHVAGAFTGADRDRPGRFAVADGGTLLLDEVAELPPSMQAKLLRVLQEGRLTPVGSDTAVDVDVRVIAASHVDLQRAVEDGRFREDLFYRLAVFPLTIPPLRERPEDVPVLAETLLAELDATSGRGPWTLDTTTRRALAARTWRGNVRELRNTLERAVILSDPGRLDPRWLVDAPQPGPSVAAPRTKDDPLATLADNERRHIERVLRHTDGRVYGDGGAAEILQVKPTTLQSRMKKLGIDRKAFAG